MINQNQVNKIKEFVAEFFSKMTIEVSSIKVELSVSPEEPTKDVVSLEIELNEPQILIGQQGQTMFEIQRLFRTILNKKLQAIFYLDLDINGYKKKKIEYLKYLAKDVADQVSFSKTEKALLPMSAYERRIIHAELSQRADVATESSGEGTERHVLVRPK